MNARDVIGDCLEDEFGVTADEQADEIISKLAAAGYSILRDDETHAPTVERCAKVADEYIWDGHALAQATQIGKAYHHQSVEIATAIRALIKEGGE